jgi:RsiW-degrading membrane proteinase PrsW (M82 family)
MVRFAIFLAAVTPGLLVLAYGVTKTRSSWRSEALWTAFFLGGLGVIGAIPVEFFVHYLVDSAPLTPLLKAGVLAVFSAATTEEAIKYLILVRAAEPHVDARRSQDLIVLAVAVSLGFATVENFAYAVVPANWLSIVTTRALTAVPEHGIDGLAMGALLTAARVEPVRRTMWAVLALVIPIIMHAAYDFPLFVIKYDPSEVATLPWLIVIWPGMLLASAIISIGLCNWILPAAKAADRLSRRDLRGDVPASRTIIAGCVLLAAISALTVLIYLGSGASLSAKSIALGIFPCALAADLIWAGLHQRTQPERRS